MKFWEVESRAVPGSLDSDTWNLARAKALLDFGLRFFCVDLVKSHVMSQIINPFLRMNFGNWRAELSLDHWWSVGSVLGLGLVLWKRKHSPWSRLPARSCSQSRGTAGMPWHCPSIPGCINSPTIWEFTAGPKPDSSHFPTLRMDTIILETPTISSTRAGKVQLFCSHPDFILSPEFLEKGSGVNWREGNSGKLGQHSCLLAFSKVSWVLPQFPYLFPSFLIVPLGCSQEAAWRN